MTKPRLDQGADYERGFVDGMQHQMQSSVDRAVNAMKQPTYYIPNKDEREWVGLTDEETETLVHRFKGDPWTLIEEVSARLEKRNT